MKPSGIGGMAVMEGVMMKNKDEYAVAVRKPNNEIVVEKNTHKDFSNKVKLFKLPIFRGMMAFVDSMVVGIKVLNFSASFFEEEEAETKKNKKSKRDKDKKAQVQDKEFVIEELSITDNEAVETAKQEKQINDASVEKKEDKMNALLMAAAVLLSIVMSVALFMVLPVLVSNLFSKFIESRFTLAFVEGLIRIAVFIGYVLLASRMPEIKRVFMYHGAEHKTINCLENGFELTVENVKWQSKQHKRCGTSFMLLVMLISLIIFIFLPPLSLLWRTLSRVLLVPIIAGISYEFIRLAGKSENKIVDILSKPGMWMQALTTKEPDDSMIEVAIQSVDAVFDWRGFLGTSVTKESAEKKSVKEKATKNNQGKKSGNAQVNQIKAEKVTTAKEDISKHKDAPVRAARPVKPSAAEEEEDEILKALDKYLDSKENVELKAE
jgi:uncharacterized protein YqhQ